MTFTPGQFGLQSFQESAPGREGSIGDQIIDLIRQGIKMTPAIIAALKNGDQIPSGSGGGSSGEGDGGSGGPVTVSPPSGGGGQGQPQPSGGGTSQALLYGALGVAAAFAFTSFSSSGRAARPEKPSRKNASGKAEEESRKQNALDAAVSAAREGAN